MKQHYNLEDISKIATTILTTVPNKTILFYGKMGVGKTTLIKEIVKQLGVLDIASSPTFSLVNEYLSKTGEKVYHFDFYRIETEEEAYDFGVEEYLYNNNWCFIEWPEKVENLLPLNSVSVYLTENNNQRTIEIDLNE